MGRATRYRECRVQRGEIMSGRQARVEMSHKDRNASSGRQEAAQQLAFTGPEMFKALVDEHQYELLTFARGIVGDIEQAQDIVQEAFYDAWRAVERQAQPFVAGWSMTEVRRWLFHATYCRAISALRRVSRRSGWQSLDQLTDAGIGVEYAAEAFEDQVAEREAIRAALSSLLPKDRACLLLITVQGFPAREAAQILGLSTQALAKRFSRAKRKLLSAYLTQESASNLPPDGRIQA
jgi:RNA polymerase sigma-70 factor (ECF subfamily)